MSKLLRSCTASGAKKPSPALLMLLSREKVVAGEGWGEGKMNAQFRKTLNSCACLLRKNTTDAENKLWFFL